MYIMSPERPPSHDGGGGVGGHTTIDTTNMVLSTMPIESNHIILQQHLQNNNNNNNNNHNLNNIKHTNNNNILNNINNNQTYTINLNNLNNNNINMTAFTTSTSSTITTPSSKLLVLQQNHMNDNFIAAGDSNNVGNIVLLATEQMEMSSTDHDIMNNNVVGTHRNGNNINADEELTPLTWLHDRNLLKGINLSKVPVSSPQSPRQTGHISPTSDFVEDSSVSEDNTCSANSSSDQSIGVYCTESSPNIRTHSFQINNHNNIVNNNNLNITNKNHSSNSLTTIIPDGTIIEYPSITDEKILTALSSSSSSPTSSTSSLYSSSPNSISSITASGSSGASTPHQHFHKKYLREEHVKTMKQVNTSFVTPVKQQYSSMKYEDNDLIDDRSYTSAPMKNNYSMNSPTSDEYCLNYNNIKEASPQSQQKLSPPKQKHPTNQPYDPLIHITSKPPYSFSSLIFMAIEGCQQKALPVKEIYAWIVQHFPYFKTAPTGWKNSVRHNLSLNKCFQKVEKAANLGKGSLWMVEQQYRPNLLQALSRSPFHSCSTLEKTAYKTTPRPADSPPNNSNLNNNSKAGARLPNPEHFPYLSRRLAALEANVDDGNSTSRPTTPNEFDSENRHNNNTIILNNNGNTEIVVRDWGADTIEDVNAATAMLALKHGPKVFNESFQNGNPPIITSSPSEDHTYSAGGTGNRSNNNSDNNSNGTSSDAAYESSEESQNLHIVDDIEEQRRQAGVDALLNLAGITNFTSTILTTPAAVPSSVTSPLKRPAISTINEKFTTNYTIIEANGQGQLRNFYVSDDTSQYSSPSPPKKSKSRILRTKLKKKAWLR